MDDKLKPKTVRLTPPALAWLELARQAIRDHDDGMVIEAEAPSDDGPPMVRMVPVDKATDSAVIAHCAAWVCRWMPPEARERAMAVETARRLYIEELTNAWQGDEN